MDTHSRYRSIFFGPLTCIIIRWLAVGVMSNGKSRGVSRRNDHENWKQETTKGSHMNRSGTIGEIHECVLLKLRMLSEYLLLKILTNEKNLNKDLFSVFLNN